MMSLEEASAIADTMGSHEIMAHLLFEAYPSKRKRYPKLTYELWLTLLGNQWIRCDRGISLFQHELREVLPHRGPMMTADEGGSGRGMDSWSAHTPRPNGQPNFYVRN
jgi:hypothetical protein